MEQKNFQNMTVEALKFELTEQKHISNSSEHSPEQQKMASNNVKEIERILSTL